MAPLQVSHSELKTGEEDFHIVIRLWRGFVILADSAEENSQVLIPAQSREAFFDLLRGMTQKMSLLQSRDFLPPLLRYAKTNMVSLQKETQVEDLKVKIKVTRSYMAIILEVGPRGMVNNEGPRRRGWICLRSFTSCIFLTLSFRLILSICGFLLIILHATTIAASVATTSPAAPLLPAAESVGSSQGHHCAHSYIPRICLCSHLHQHV
ncbi:unnamed protein product [Brassica napus]|uniref:(rape) hypothetical protein n=1 Tax=Brassica napus TaxID=3708 RepID=A0A816XZI4_BRANA|nr:unnamed protein product [Brassica napus]